MLTISFSYRMQLWGKMAAQHHAHQQQLAQQHQHQSQQHHSPLTGPAAALRPAYLAPHLSPKAALSPNAGLGSTLSALLSGKHTPSTTSSHGLLTPPASPRLGAQSTKALPPSSSSTSQTQSQREREKEAQAAVLAVVASQTLFKKLGNAFWDAFSGSSSPSSSPSSSSTSTTTSRNWDADKVRKVLEGKAVVKVVDVEPAPAMSAPVVPAASASAVDTGNATSREGPRRRCEDVKCSVGELLEESMRSLTLGKGSGAARRH